MVEAGNILHHVKWEEKLSGRWKFRGDMSEPDVSMPAFWPVGADNPLEIPPPPLVG